MGKSSIMSLLAGSRTGSGKPAVFRPETKEVWESDSYQTAGLDMAVTPERVVLLDTQVRACVCISLVISYTNTPYIFQCTRVSTLKFGCVCSLVEVPCITHTLSLF